MKKSHFIVLIIALVVSIASLAVGIGALVSTRDNGATITNLGQINEVHPHELVLKEVTEKEPTCTQVGVKYIFCETCGELIKTVITEKLPHNYNDVVTDPTCTEQGFTTHTCSCGDSYVDNYVNALGHSYNDVVTDPTCTEKGYTTHTCQDCEFVLVDSYVDELGHSYEEEYSFDTNQHWKNVTCGHDYVVVKENHNLNEYGTCVECGFVQKIPVFAFAKIYGKDEGELSYVTANKYFGPAEGYMRQYFYEVQAQWEYFINDFSSQITITTFDAISFAGYCPIALIERWEDLILQAMMSIEDLEISDPVKYQMYKDHIELERVFPLYCKCTTCAGHFADASLREYRLIFKEICTRLNVILQTEYNFIDLVSLYDAWHI